MNRDIYQKIASLSDDKTALAILASIEEMNNKYLAIFGTRYPDLIKYRQEDESIKKLYLRMLEIIGTLKEQYKLLSNLTKLKQKLNLPEDTCI